MPSSFPLIPLTQERVPGTLDGRDLAAGGDGIASPAIGPLAWDCAPALFADIRGRLSKFCDNAAAIMMKMRHSHHLQPVKLRSLSSSNVPVPPFFLNINVNRVVEER